MTLSKKGILKNDDQESNSHKINTFQNDTAELNAAEQL
jgi:hypothetical protein